MDSTLVNAQEAAAILGISRPTFQKRVEAGQIKPAMLIGKRAVFYREEMERLAAERGGDKRQAAAI